MLGQVLDGLRKLDRRLGEISEMQKHSDERICRHEAALRELRKLVLPEEELVKLPPSDERKDS
eukprot:CAMPEP_0180825792 /NCGR_PEP_ID=MMETSP1038_2-20121128/73170_1 /TAXON_ID=632150 /ORGANISM="Azadinium spinosum, Strain 3D9" /LENGTH=62 /DNA_ID=CAMNT_0022868299 /DNA_START=1 /DNA_END=186 /DNA_ORIENTATION=+